MRLTNDSFGKPCLKKTVQYSVTTGYHSLNNVNFKYPLSVGKYSTHLDIRAFGSFNILQKTTISSLKLCNCKMYVKDKVCLQSEPILYFGYTYTELSIT